MLWESMAALSCNLRGMLSFLIVKTICILSSKPAGKGSFLFQFKLRPKSSISVFFWHSTGYINHVFSVTFSLHVSLFLFLFLMLLLKVFLKVLVVYVSLLIFRKSCVYFFASSRNLYYLRRLISPFLPIELFFK